MAGAGNRRGAGAERDRRRRGPLEAEAASDRERPAAAGPDPGCTSCTCVGGGGAKGSPRHRSGATVERDRLGQNVKSRQRPEVCPRSVGELGVPRDADHAWPEAPPWRRAAQRRQCGCDPKRDRHSPSTRIPRSCDRVEVPPSSCPPEPNPANGAESAAHDLQAAEEADPRKGFAAGALGT